MAAKLAQRWFRLYRVSSPLCLQASTVSARIQVARVSSQLPLALVTTCSGSVQTDKPSIKEPPDRALPELSPLDHLIGKVPTAEELLQLVDIYPINGNQAALIITRLSRMVTEKKLDPGSFMEDVRFQQLLQTVHTQVSRVWNAALTHLLRSLYLLGLDRRRKELLSVEQEVRWRLRRLSFRHLASLAEQVAAGAPEGGQSVLLSDLVKQLELRWTEIEDTRTVVGLMGKVGALSPVLMERLEDKGLEMAEQFSPEDTRRVALALALQNRRSVPLLRALSYHLVQKHFTLSPTILLDLAFAYGKLNFHQTQVFQKIASDLQPRVPELSPVEVVRCVKSFAYLKWLNLPLFEAVAQYVMDNAGKVTPVQLSNVILAFARLNFQPSNKEAFYKVVHERLGDCLDDLEPHLLLDLVWSLCVLEQAQVAHLQKVLEPTFHARFLGDQSPKGRNYQLKLLHINATARLECPDYEGPFLPEEEGSLWVKELQGERKASPLQSGFREALRAVAGEEGKVRFEVDTPWGWLLEAEMVLDSDNRPLPLADFPAAPLLPRSGASKPLLSGVKRLAFLTWEFPNFSNRSKDLLGRFAMARRHVQAAGFVVVDVPYYEFLDLKSEWQKEAFLRDKMSKAVAEEMAK
nr:PREDICTED: protein TBRG4 [Anolis carolinensis]|eukprot:XP_008122206.1 PREDICTED: protein TBRG4 [Anolis carolinensis]